MAFQPVPNVLLVELLWTYNSQQCETTLYFERASGWPADTIFAFCGAINASAIATILPTTPNSAQLRGVKGTDLTTQEGAAVEFLNAPPAIGGSNAGAAPNNVTLAINFKTEARGKTGRGRNYIIGIQKDETNNNQIAQTAIDRWLAFYDEIISAPFASQATWVVVSRYLNKAKRPEGIARPVLTYGASDNIVDSQRRRLPGRGS